MRLTVVGILAAAAVARAGVYELVPLTEAMAADAADRLMRNYEAQALNRLHGSNQQAVAEARAAATAATSPAVRARARQWGADARALDKKVVSLAARDGVALTPARRQRLPRRARETELDAITVDRIRRREIADLESMRVAARELQGTPAGDLFAQAEGLFADRLRTVGLGE
jgi:hypothetical protein